MLSGSPSDCFRELKVRMPISLHPSRLGPRLQQGIEEHLNYLLMTYVEDLEGLPLSYSSVQVEEPVARIMFIRPHVHFTVIAKLLCFCPAIGSILQGRVNKVGNDHISLLVHGTFNVSVAAADIPPEYKYQAGSDSWVSKKGDEFAVGSETIVRVIGLQNTEEYFSIIGSLYPEAAQPKRSAPPATPAFARSGSALTPSTAKAKWTVNSPTFRPQAAPVTPVSSTLSAIAPKRKPPATEPPGKSKKQKRADGSAAAPVSDEVQEVLARGATKKKSKAPKSPAAAGAAPASPAVISLLSESKKPSKAKAASSNSHSEADVAGTKPKKSSSKSSAAAVDAVPSKAKANGVGGVGGKASKEVLQAAKPKKHKKAASHSDENSS